MASMSLLIIDDVDDDIDDVVIDDIVIDDFVIDDVSLSSDYYR